MNKCKVRFRLNRHMLGEEIAWPPLEVESLWAEIVGTGTARLLNYPFYAKGVSYLDEISIKPAESPPNEGAEGTGPSLFDFGSVLRHSGHGTVRVVLTSEKHRDQAEEAVSQVEKLGCTFESADFDLPTLAIDVPPQVDQHRVMAILEQAAVTQSVYVDIGFLPQNSA